MSTPSIETLEEKLENLTKKYEKLSDYVATIVHKHENVMSSVLEHLVHQATVLKQYSASPQYIATELPCAAVSSANQSIDIDVDNDTVTTCFRNMFISATPHFRTQITDAEMNIEPFPYIYVKDIFPAELYQQILKNIPENNKLKTLHELGRVSAGYSEKRKAMSLDTDGISVLSGSIQHNIWLSISNWFASPEFQNVITQKFRSFIAARFQDQKPTLTTSSFFISDQAGYQLGPHTDAAWKVVTLLFYLPSDNSMSALGTSIYRHNDPDFECAGGPHHNRSDFKLCKTCEFLPNTMFGFFRTSTSFHGVEPVVQHDVIRNIITVQFCVK